MLESPKTSVKVIRIKEAPDCNTNSLCQCHRNCKEDGVENMNTDVRV